MAVAETCNFRASRSRVDSVKQNDNTDRKNKRTEQETKFVPLMLSLISAVCILSVDSRKTEARRKLEYVFFFSFFAF